ncbi:hypothetical protein [Clostridium sp. Marseille-P299]|uniref:hypothetical protein n=1 Tax=Clostridium sp. Marseille-P299 TaxID=1805477 RepID=UPI00083623DF|nr:hypothetical protein [Clostridium sp. Marseille-P299]
MLDKLYGLVTPWAISNKKQILKNRIIGRLANYTYPVYCKYNRIQKTVTEKKKIKIVVSLTTYPLRLKEVYYCLNSLIRQTKRADIIILWLAEEQFPNRERDVPNEIKNLKQYGLDIRFCKDLRSYKKIFYTAQDYKDSIIITADDDVLYPEYWIEKLYNTYREYPECVVCFRAHEMLFDKGTILPYRKWNGMAKNVKGPSLNLMPVGVGGVLYPPYYFSNVEFNDTMIMKLAPTTDDIWLKVIGIINNYSVVKVDKNSKEWFTIKGTQRISLKSYNVDTTNANDEALKKFFEYYGLDFKKFS